MAFDARFLKLMPCTITWSTWTGADGYAEPTYSTTVNSCRARVERDPKLDVDRFGSDVVISHYVIAASTTFIPATAQFTVEGDQPNLLHVTQVYDDEGLHHQELYFGGVPVG